MISIPLEKMSLAEKLEAMEALWADLSRTPADVPVPQWHRDVLQAREDLRLGFRFYEEQASGLGRHFLECLFAAIDSLTRLAGIHETVAGFKLLLPIDSHAFLNLVPTVRQSLW